jgi:5-methyltetrahydropteroyltriglutamate--homocysteine methyltransferase
VLAVSFGNYPRVGDTPGEQTLRRALHAFDRGEIAAEELEAVRRDVVKTVLREQAEAGLDVVTDGQVTWNDPLSHVARGLEGVEINGLLRWFDNNFYYRQPVLAGTVRWARPILLEELEYASAAADRPLKAVLPGPLTFAAMSREGAGPVRRALAVEIAEALNRELQSWAEIDLAYVQVEEPSFGDDTDRGLLRELYAALLRDVALPVLVAPYFRDVSRAWPALLELPVAGFHLDLRSHAANAAALSARGFPEGAALSLGVLDARNTRRESPAEVAREVERLRSGIPAKAPLLLTTSCGLEFLPRSAAREKLRILAEVRDLVAGTPAAVGAR